MKNKNIIMSIIIMVIFSIMLTSCGNNSAKSEDKFNSVIDEICNVIDDENLCKTIKEAYGNLNSQTELHMEISYNYEDSLSITIQKDRNNVHIRIVTDSVSQICGQEYEFDK